MKRSFFGKLFLFALPIMAQNMVTLSVNLADNVMVGSLNELALSGVFVANQLQGLLQMLVTGIGAAMMILGAQYWGKKDRDSTGAVVSIALRFAVGVALVLTLLTCLFPTAVLRLFTNDPEVVSAAMPYFSLVRLGYLFFCVTQVLVGAMRCVGKVGIGMALSLTTLFVNVFLNWVLIFGNLGAPALGIQGAAIATLTARTVEFLLVLLYVFRLEKNLRFRLLDLRRFPKTLARDFFKYGCPVILGDVLWGTNLAVQGIIIGRLGQTAIAAVSMTNTLFSLITVGIYGLAAATAVLVGQMVGAGEIDRLRHYVKLMQPIFLVGGILTSLLLYFIKDGYIAFFYPTLAPQTVAMVKEFLLVLCVTIIGTAYEMSVLTGFVRAGGSTYFVLVNDCIFIWLIAIPVSIVAAFVLHAPPWVVFACLKSDQILKCIVAFIKVNRFNWIKNLTRTVPDSPVGTKG